MHEIDAFDEQVRKLLAQDQHINEPELKEFRMRLESTLASWEHRAHTVRRALYVAVVVFIATYLIGIGVMPVVQIGQKAMDDGWLKTLYSAVIGGWFVAAIMSFVIGVYLLLLYTFKYGPALKRARFDVQTTMILELQEQVAQLRQELREGGESRGAAPP